jgi:hypothetical protein
VDSESSCQLAMATDDAQLSLQFFPRGDSEKTLSLSNLVLNKHYPMYSLDGRLSVRAIVGAIVLLFILEISSKLEYCYDRESKGCRYRVFW